MIYLVSTGGKPQFFSISRTGSRSSLMPHRTLVSDDRSLNAQMSATATKYVLGLHWCDRIRHIGPVFCQRQNSDQRRETPECSDVCRYCSSPYEGALLLLRSMYQAFIDVIGFVTQDRRSVAIVPLHMKGISYCYEVCPRRSLM